MGKMFVIISLIMMMFPEQTPGIIKCSQIARNSTGNGINNAIHCAYQFIWETGNVDWSKFNITKREQHYVNSLIGSIHHRRKRQADTSSQNRIRLRREYRMLSDRERFNFHTTINIMKISGQYDMLANIHRGVVVTSANGRANFPSWHRVYLLLFEEALRRISPTVTLPYWDSTMDFDMDNPTRSIVWTASFLGNGDGLVTSGPFANWITPVGRLTRNVGAAGSLFSKQFLRSVLRLCRTRDILETTAESQFNLDLIQGGVLIWVGGQMSGLDTAAYDPVFFLHHAFVDLVWELFRIRQAHFCGIDPTLDYPLSVGEHAPLKIMPGFTTYRNIDGYGNFWTRIIYRYAPLPSCSTAQPFCGSIYLKCDTSRQRCISVPRQDNFGTNFALMSRARVEASTLNFGPRLRSSPSKRRNQDFQFRRRRTGFAESNIAEASNRSSVQSILRARAQEASINVGPRFAAPPSEPRTQEARFGFMDRRF